MSKLDLTVKLYKDLSVRYLINMSPNVFSISMFFVEVFCADLNITSQSSLFLSHIHTNQCTLYFITQVHGKRYAYRFSWAGLAAACQAQVADTPPYWHYLPPTAHAQHAPPPQPPTTQWPPHWHLSSTLSSNCEDKPYTVYTPPGRI